MFTPSRLTLARKRRGLTKKALAEAVGVTSRAVTAFEAGDYSPDSDTLTRVAQALDFPVGFFEGPDLEEVVADAASFRSMSKMSAGRRDAALGAGTLAFLFYDWMTRRYRLPATRVPRLDPGTDPETAADAVRAEWGLGEAPVSNMVHVLEAHGVRVFSLAETSRDVDAFSLWRGDTPFVFLNTQKSGEHSRFDAAHELGHLVLHWHHDGPQGKEAEHEAQQFASAFLMPRSRMLATAPRWPTLADLVEVKQPWKASVAALNYRLHQLGITTDWHYRTLCVEIAKAGYRTDEPQPIQRETSQVLSKVFAALRRDGIGKADIARELHLDAAELDAFVFHLALLPVGGHGTASSGAAGGTRPSLSLVRGGV